MATNGDISSFESLVLNNQNVNSHPKLANSLLDYLEAVAVDGHVPMEDVIAAIYELAPVDELAAAIVEELIEELQSAGLVLAIVSDGGEPTAEITVDEGTVDVTTVFALDPQGDDITYSIVGGADASLFEIDATMGGLVFVAPQDFEAPADVGADNTYVVEVQAYDAVSGQTDTQTFTVNLTNVNESPTIENATIEAQEDGPYVTVDLSTLADDVDADDNSSTLAFEILSGPSQGSATINGTNLEFDPAGDFEDLAVGESRDVIIQVSVTDSHGAVGTGQVTVTVHGENDNPVISEGMFEAQEDGPVATLDLGTLADDMDSDDDGATLTYQILSAPTEGMAAINGTLLEFDAAGDFEDLANGETRDAVVEVLVTDTHGGTSTAQVTVTVVGADEPVPPPDSFGTIFTGVDREDFSGYSIAGIDDINGDGLSDVLIGAYIADPNGVGFAGEAYVVFGQSGGLGPVVDLESLDGTNGFTIDGYVFDGRLGLSVAGLGDIDGDGLSDVLVGSDSAEAYVIYSNTSFAARIDAAGLDGTDGTKLQGGSTFEVNDAGDFNGDGVDDFLVGGGGRATVIYGQSQSLGSTFDFSNLDASSGFTLYGASGWKADGVGDINGDGIDDIAVSNLGSAVYVVYGDDARGGPSLNVAQLDGTNGFKLSPVENGDYFGTAASGIGDFNGDGFDDFVVGASSAGPEEPRGAGDSYLIFGSDQGFPADLNVANFNGSNGIVLSGVDAADEAGQAAAGVGDVNGDGFADVLIGAEYGDEGGRSSGESYLVFGTSAVIVAALDLGALDGTDGFVFKGVDRGDLSGHAVAGAGDTNGDGVDDLLISAYFADPNFVYNSGESYLVYGGDALFQEFDLRDGVADGTIDLQLIGSDPHDVFAF